MAILYYKKDTKITDTASIFFDIKSKSSTIRKDLDFSVNGLLQRVVGIDKLKQQTEKMLLARKGSYTSAIDLGTSPSTSKKDLANVTNSIVKSLTTYSKLQQQKKNILENDTLGKNVYRTVDINDSESWVKINDFILSRNTFIDSDLLVGTTYHYAITTVFRDTTNKMKETSITNSQSVTISSDETLSSEVNSDFILLNGAQRALLYWNLPIKLNEEEQLRSIINVNAAPFGSDPRGLSLDVSISNLELTSAQIKTLKG